MARWSPLSGAMFVALSVVAFVLRSDAPLSDDPDTTILKYFDSNGNRDRDVAAFLCALAAALFFVWFLSVLCMRLVRADDTARALTAAAFGAGLISATLWLAAKALLISSSAASSTSEFQLDPNTFRILNDIGFILWISGTTIAAVTVIATALVSLRSGPLPKWLAWLSLLVAATMLLAVLAFFFLSWLGWVLVVSIVLTWRHEPLTEGTNSAAGPQTTAGTG
jgi:hypothetical protein